MGGCACPIEWTLSGPRKLDYCWWEEPGTIHPEGKRGVKREERHVP